MNSQPPLITTTNQLADICARMAGHSDIAIDTEFLRETTYYPKLCLVQLASPDEAAAIDPLADGIDLTPLIELLRDTNTTKVFHAGKQDLEIFFRMMGELPRSLYDTQIAAMVCGLGDQVGYDKLINHILGIRIDKSSQFTDWSRRPLSPRQYRYALDDVIHLERAYHIIKDRINTAGRHHWLTEEMNALCRPEQYQVDKETIWTRIKHRIHKPQALNRLRHLGHWREQEAQSRDKPRQRIAKDDTLVSIAMQGPKTLAELNDVRGVNPNVTKPYGDALVALIAKADNEDRALWPAPPSRPEKPAPQATSDLLKVLLKHCAESTDVASRLIASNQEIESLAKGQHEGLMALSGWRHEVFGQWAEKLLNGDIAISAKGNKTIIVPK
jgi:ribonuclease D